MRIGQHLSLLANANVSASQAQLHLRNLGAAVGTSKQAEGESLPLLFQVQPSLRDTFSFTTQSLKSTSLLEASTSVDDSFVSFARVEGLINKVRQLAASPAADVAQRRGQQADVDAALIEIGRLTGAEIRQGGTSSAVVTGLSEDQFANVQVTAVNSTAQLAITGEVTRAATAAELTLLETTDGKVAEDTRFVLSSNRGTAVFDLQAGESLAAVATRVNQQSNQTGVLAAVDNKTLMVRSDEIGAAATLRSAKAGKGETTIVSVNIDGANDSQVGEFIVTNLTNGTEETITGNVVSSATAGEIRYTGTGGGFVAGTATFRLTGTEGSSDFAITDGESLTAVASRINAESALTGVTASVEGGDIVFTTEAIGSEAFVQIETLSREEETITTGVNQAQVSSFDITTFTAGASQTISGEVTQAAAQAELTLTVASGGSVTADATFSISGNSGTTQIIVNEGESTDDVVDRINTATETTGVTASLSGNDIVLTSVQRGTSALIEVELLEIQHDLSVSTIKNEQLDQFEVLTFTDGAQQTLSGTIDQAADVAELTYEAPFGVRVGVAAQFTLTGSLGSVEITTTVFQRISDLADEINDSSDLTGVTASSNGDTLTLQSTAVGSDAFIDINVNAGSFDTTGGNGDNTANGSDAVATINGQTITASANDFAYSDALGSYAFTAKQGFVGAIDDITIDSQARDFTVTGGNEDGTANGLDTIVEINGQQLTSEAGDFSVTTANGTFAIQFADDFTGEFDSIDVISTFDDFDITGGDENGRNTGSDAVAIINGLQHQGDANQFSVDGEHGSYVVEFVAGFSGTFDAITASSTIETIASSRAGPVLVAYGQDAEATINGKLLTGDGPTLTLAENGVEANLTLRPGFSGTLQEGFIGSRIVVRANEDASPTNAQDEVAQAIGPLLQFASGGHLAVGSESLEEINAVADAAIANLARLQSKVAVDPAGRPLTQSSFQSTSGSKATIVANEFNRLVQDTHQRTMFAINFGNFDSDRQLIVDLLL